MNAAFKNRLSAAQNAWQTGKDKAPGVDDGVYALQLASAKLGESQSQNLMITRKHLVLEGEFAGETVTDYLMVDSEQGPYYVARWIENMGYTAPDNIENLESIIEEIVAASPCYNATVRKAKDSDIRNVLFKELIENPGTPAPAKEQKKRGRPSNASKAAAPETTTENDSQSSDLIAPNTEIEFLDGGAKRNGTVQGMAVDYGAPNDYVVLCDGKYYQVAPNEVTAVAAAQDENQDAKKRADLLAFCQSQDIEVTDADTIESMTQKLSMYEFKRADYLPEEITLLQSVGATIVEPPPVIKKPALTPKAPVTAPVTKAPLQQKPSLNAPTAQTGKPALKPLVKK